MKIGNPRIGDIYVLREEEFEYRDWRIVHIIRVGEIRGDDVTADAVVVDPDGLCVFYKNVSMASNIWSYGAYSLVRDE